MELALNEILSIMEFFLRENIKRKIINTNLSAFSFSENLLGDAVTHAWRLKVETYDESSDKFYGCRYALIVYRYAYRVKNKTLQHDV
jgi:hypothetical protein